MRPGDQGNYQSTDPAGLVAPQPLSGKGRGARGGEPVGAQNAALATARPGRRCRTPIAQGACCWRSNVHQHLHPVDRHQPVRSAATTRGGPAAPVIHRLEDPHARPGRTRCVAREVTDPDPPSALVVCYPEDDCAAGPQAQ